MLDSSQTLVDIATRYFEKDDRIKLDNVMAMFLVIHHDMADWMENTNEGKEFLEKNKSIIDKIGEIFYWWGDDAQPYNFAWCETCWDDRDDSHIWDDGSGYDTGEE